MTCTLVSKSVELYQHQRKGIKMTNQITENQNQIHIAREALRVVNSELKRLRTELPQIIEWDKFEFQQNEIRQNEGAQHGIIARIQRLENEGSN